MKARIAVIAALVTLATGVSGCGSATPSQHAAGTPTPVTRQSVLSFTGLEGPHDVSVDTTGSAYVDDTHTVKSDKGFPTATNRLLKLAAGWTTQTELPFPGGDLVVDPAGTTYVIDHGHDRLVKLANGPARKPRCHCPTSACTAGWLQWAPRVTCTTSKVVAWFPAAGVAR